MEQRTAAANGVGKVQREPPWGAEGGIMSVDTGPLMSDPHAYAVLVERIRHARYRQFFYDRLPLGGTSESILRFDQMFPVSHNAQSHERTGFRLSDRALELLDEWLDWFVTGDAPHGEFGAFRDLTAAMDAQANP